jgi:hypothetical protein
MHLGPTRRMTSSCGCIRIAGLAILVISCMTFRHSVPSTVQPSTVAPLTMRHSDVAHTNHEMPSGAMPISTSHRSGTHHQMACSLQGCIAQAPKPFGVVLPMMGLATTLILLLGFRLRSPGLLPNGNAGRRARWPGAHLLSPRLVTCVMRT